MLNMDYKISPLPIWRYISIPSVTLHLRNYNKQQVILTKFYVDSVGNQTAKFHSNLP